MSKERPEEEPVTYDEVRHRLDTVAHDVATIDNRVDSLRDVMLATVRSLQKLTDSLEGLDSPGHRADDATDVGQSEAAQLFLGDSLSKVEIYHLASGSNSQMTVEVSNDGHEWYQKDQQTQSSADNIFQYDVPWLYIRAHADQNLGYIEISAKDV